MLHRSRSVKQKHTQSVYKDTVGKHLSVLSDIYWFDNTVGAATMVQVHLFDRSLIRTVATLSGYVFPGN